MQRILLVTAESKTGMVPAIMQLTFSSKKRTSKKGKKKVISGTKGIIRNINQGNMIKSEEGRGGSFRCDGWSEKVAWKK